MRKILRDTCIFAALMILTVFAFSIVTAGMTAEIKLVFQIFHKSFRIFRNSDIPVINMVTDIFQFIAFPVQISGPVNHAVDDHVAFDQLQVFIRIQSAKGRKVLRTHHIEPVKFRVAIGLFDISEQGKPAACLCQCFTR